MATVQPPVNPIAGPNTSTGTAGVPVIALGNDINGGWIANPSDATDILYVDPTGNNPNTSEGGTTFPIYPGTTYSAIPGQTTVTKVVSSNPNHAFTAVQW